MIESLAHVRRTLPAGPAEEGVLLVSFAEHDAYFRARGPVRAFFEACDRTGQPVRFRYDADLEIVSAQAHPPAP